MHTGSVPMPSHESFTPIFLGVTSHVECWSHIQYLANIHDPEISSSYLPTSSGRRGRLRVLFFTFVIFFLLLVCYQAISLHPLFTHSIHVNQPAKSYSLIELTVPNCPNMSFSSWFAVILSLRQNHKCFEELSSPTFSVFPFQ